MQLRNQIYIMRHGQSENNILRLESFLPETQVNFGLTDLGRQQVKKAAAEFCNFQVIYSSPFRRTVETADLMAASSKCEVYMELGLLEFRLPSEFDLCTYEECHEFYTDPANDIKSTATRDGESFDLMYERVKAAITKIDAEHENAKILLVSHGSPVKAAQQVMSGQSTGFGPWSEIPKNAEVVHLNSIKILEN